MNPNDPNVSLLERAAEQLGEALLEQLVDDALASPRFYAQMVAFGHDWLRVGRYSTGAQGVLECQPLPTVLQECG